MWLERKESYSTTAAAAESASPYLKGRSLLRVDCFGIFLKFITSYRFFEPEKEATFVEDDR